MGMVINPIVGFPIKGGMAIPNIRNFDPLTTSYESYPFIFWSPQKSWEVVKLGESCWLQNGADRSADRSKWNDMGPL